MLTPVALPAATPQKSAPSSPVAAIQSASSPVTPAARAETATAVDPVRAATAAQGLRSGENRETARDGPVGPRPAFRETLLQRQSRTAFDPPKPAPSTPTDGTRSAITEARTAGAPPTAAALIDTRR